MVRRRRWMAPRRIALAAVVCVAVVVGAGVALGGRARSTGSLPATVGLVGDSLLVESKDDLERAMGTDVELRIAAWPGLEIREMHDEAVDLAGDVDALVIVLGTNNAADGWYDLDSDEVTALLDATASARCRRWVALTETAGREPFDAGARTANAVLADEAVGRGGFAVVAWDERIRDDPAYLHEDRVHHSEAGQVAFAAAIVDAVRTCR